MTREFTKAFKTYDEQLEILASRNLPAYDRIRCLNALRQVGYYRLSAYWYPFRIRDVDHVEGVDSPHEEVFPGLYFDDIVSAYEFDRALRHTLIRALDRIELATRTAIAYQLGQSDIYAFEDIGHFSENSSAPSYWNPGISKFDAFHQMLSSRKLESKEVFVQHFMERNEGRMPVWVSVETWDFGTLNTCYQLLRSEDRLAIAAALGFTSARTLGSWLEPFRVLRNMCAHHSRLNRRHLASIPRFAKVDRYDHIHRLQDQQKHRIYPMLVAISEFLRNMGVQSEFVADVHALFSDLSERPAVTINDYGFPEEWSSEEVWEPSVP